MSVIINQLKGHFTFADYKSWAEDERWEIVDGEPYNMTPSPSTKHQEVLGELHRLFSVYLHGKTSRVYLSPFDVRLPEKDELDEEIQTVVQPELTIICDRTKIDDYGCKGAPNLIIEILSPATMKRDLGLKLNLYERAGVHEYWVVHPIDQTVMIFILSKGEYGKPIVYKAPDEVRVGLFEDLVIPLGEVFGY